MKTLIRIIKLLLFLMIAGFIVLSLSDWYLYRTHPEHDVGNSAPWYLPIQIRAVFTGAGTAVFLWILGRLKKRR